MAQYKAMAPGIEVNGETVLSVVTGMGVFANTARSILSSNGIVDPKPGQWYPQQAWLDAFHQISLQVGPAVLYQIGKSIPTSAQFPPQISDIESALAAIDIAYHMNHRKNGTPLLDARTGTLHEGIGHYAVAISQRGEQRARMVCDNPYPCEFDRGIIDAMAKRFKPASSAQVRVEHDESGPCRKKGAEACHYTVTW